MFAVKFDLRDIEKAVDRLEGARDQIPFVMSGLLNDAVFKARQVLVESTWPEHVIQRNSAFLNAALRIDRASKQDLKATLYDSIGRLTGGLTILQAHAKGGTKRPARRHLAIPDRAWRTYGTHGIRPSETPKALAQRALEQRGRKAVPVRGGKRKRVKRTRARPAERIVLTERGIFAAIAGKLHLRYLFRPSAQIKADVPLYEDFEHVVRETIRTGFADKMAQAMRTRR